jgi:transcriptional regulator with XRE-family HTH domain
MRDEHQESIGRTIAQLREGQGWSQRQLAKWVGLDQSAVSRIEAGRRRVSAKELQIFADAFRVSADELLLRLSGDEPSPSAAPPAPATPFPTTLPSQYAFADAFDAELEEASSKRLGDFEDEPRAHGDISAREHRDIGGQEDTYASTLPSGPRVTTSSLRSELSAPRFAAPTRSLQLQAAAPAGPAAPAPTASPARLKDLPPEVAAVVRGWFELRRLAGGDEPALGWSTGHSAEGKPERFAHPVQPAERGSLGGDVLYDRVARFWRSELHVEPDDGPLPDLVPLLEDGLGVQVIVARAAGGEAAPAAGPVPVSAERPVCANLTAGATPFLFVNASRPVVLQRFALAHAFAHLVLGHGDVVDGRIHWSRNNPREAAANDFAEEFLAPVRAIHRWYERRGEPRPEVDTMLELGNAFGISAWAALYRSRAARRVHAKQFAKLNQQMHDVEWELLPRQAYLGGLRDTLTHLTPGECLPQGGYGSPAVLLVPASMRAWALAAVRGGRLSIERGAAFLQTDARELAAQLARLGLE